jgi:hypothetical protein
MKPVAYLLLTGLLATACGGHGDGDGHGDGHDDAMPEVDACEHMIEGPEQAATAVADMSADAPDVGEHHTRFDIALVAGASGMYAGHVDLVVEEAGISDLFLDADVPVNVSSASGSEVMAHHAQTNITECTEVSVGLGYQLGVGTYRVGFGPTTAQSVSVVVILEEEGEH